MTTKKSAPAGPERVHSKSFNGSKRGTVLRRHTASKAHSYFGAEFALVEFDHHPEPIWLSQKFLAKPTKADRYERWRAAPLAVSKAVVGEDTESVIRTCARVSGGQSTHHDGAVRWLGLVRPLALDEGTEALLTLLERLDADEATTRFDEPHALDGSEYNKSDFKYGPRVRGDDVHGMILSGLTRYWRYAVGGQPTTVAEALSPRLRARVEAALADTYGRGREHLHERLTAPTLREAFQGTSFDWNEACELDAQHPMVGGTGY